MPCLARISHQISAAAYPGISSALRTSKKTEPAKVSKSIRRIQHYEKGGKSEERFSYSCGKPWSFQHRKILSLKIEIAMLAFQ
jgi:hypothetical protein